MPCFRQAVQGWKAVHAVQQSVQDQERATRLKRFDRRYPAGYQHKIAGSFEFNSDLACHRRVVLDKQNGSIADRDYRIQRQISKSKPTIRQRMSRGLRD